MRSDGGEAPARRLVILLAAVLTMAVTARMGWWQLDRAQQKLELQASIERQALLPPLTEADLAHDPGAASRQWYRRVQVRGEWLDRRTVFLDNRQMAGRPGFFVLTPLRLPQGDAVLVQRGWVPRDMQDRTRLPSLPLPAGPVAIQARIAPWPSRLADLGPEPGGAIRQNIALDDFEAEIRTPLRPLSLVQLAAQAGPDGLLRDWPLPAVDVDKHYGYAAQWFTFCAMIAGLYVWFQLIRPRRLRATG